MSKHAPRLLNLGCGARSHPAWTNVDRYSTGPGVLGADLSHPLPFPDASFDACYASHVLEHFQPPEGARLLREMWRVLEPGGTVRIVVPDLERAARAYLEVLEAESHGTAEPMRHEWMLIELFDQMTRERSGGQMAPLLSTADAGLRCFIESRVGTEAIDQAPPRRGVRPLLWPAVLREGRTRIAGALVFLVSGRDLWGAFRTAVFRCSGEIHRAAYDRWSLARALIAAGFSPPRRVGHDESEIPGFTGYGLDTEAGRARKPDSLFMEASRPKGRR